MNQVGVFLFLFMNTSKLKVTKINKGNCVIRNIVLKATFQVDAANQPNRPIAMVKSYNKSCIVWYRQNNLEVFFF